MKKLFSFFFFLIPLCVIAQIQHLENFWGSPHSLGVFNLKMEEFERLKGNIHKVIYEEPGIIIGLEYDESGQLIFARFFSDGKHTYELNRAEIIGIFNDKGKLTGAKCPYYYRSSETELTQGKSTFLKYLHFTEGKDSISKKVVLEFNSEDILTAINADVIDKKKNIREQFYLSFNEVDLDLNSKEIQKVLNLEVAKLWFEKKDLFYVSYIKTFYTDNKPIEYHSCSLSARDSDGKMKISKPQYLTENSGIFPDSKTEFKLINGEAISIILPIADEKFTYDENGNWTTHEFTRGDTKIKAKRYIEYWD